MRGSTPVVPTCRIARPMSSPMHAISAFPILGRHILAFTVVCLTMGLLTGCGSSHSKTITPPPTIAIAAGSGAGQTATVGGPFANPLVAIVTSNGSPLSGATVTFSVPGSGASCALSTPTATTDANGKAPVNCTANTAAGAYNVTASTTGATASASFGLTNNAGAAATINATSGSSQSATVATAFASNLQATVVDKYLNPVSGLTVTFAAPTSGANCAPSNATPATDTNGNVSVTCTANTKAGSYTVTASVPGVTAPASYSLTNIAGTAATISATGGTPQSAGMGRPFANSLAASVVDSYSNPVSNVSVTFAVPQSGASCTLSSTTQTTDANGNVSVTCTANAQTGAYTATASASGVTTPANFGLTNGTVYVFYLSGEELPNNNNGSLARYYALAGVALIDPNGTVVVGEQDYNDGKGITSPQGGDSITGGTLNVSNTSGQGTLSLITNNPHVGVAGTETLAVQFVNPNHALIAQFDGSATSSGSMDAQTSVPAGGNFAFTLSGTDSSYGPVGYGGVFTVGNEGTLTGTADVNDAGTMTQGLTLTGATNAVDANGRGTATLTINNTTLSLVYYIVGAEAIRIIDVDPGGVSEAGSAAVGSAYGQGSGTFDSTALGASVFGIEQGNPLGYVYSAVGSFTATSTQGSAAGQFSGIGDDDENYQPSFGPISGSYTIGSNGYGLLTNPNGLGTIEFLGLYVTDPKLNLLDPNNTASGTGGALLLDLDAAKGASFSGGVGIIISQTDTSTSSFENSTYTVGAQDYNVAGEFDFVGQAPFSTLALSGATANLSDPFGFFATANEYTAVPLTGTAVPDASNAGRYTMQLDVTPSGTASHVFDSVVIYQANGGQLLWAEKGCCSLFLGSMEQQNLSSPDALRRKGAAAAKPQAKRNLSR